MPEHLCNLPAPPRLLKLILSELNLNLKLKVWERPRTSRNLFYVADRGGLSKIKTYLLLTLNVGDSLIPGLMSAPRVVAAVSFDFVPFARADHFDQVVLSVELNRLHR